MKTKLNDIMDTQAWEIYLANRWQNFLPMITLWHIFQILKHTITLPELNLLISADGQPVDCGKAGKWIPWKYVVLSPGLLEDLRKLGTLQAMENSGRLDRHRHGCFKIVGSEVVFMHGTPYYRNTPKGYKPEVVDGDRAIDPKLEVGFWVVNTHTQIGRHIIDTKEWPMTQQTAVAKRFNPKPVHQDRPKHPVRRQDQPFFVKRFHESKAILQVGVASTPAALQELEVAFG
ncbi:MAG: hypothetical protein RLZZ347_853 [Candidatus Parcubacteria bacterium]